MLVGLELPNSMCYKKNETKIYDLIPTQCPHQETDMQSRSAGSKAWWLCKTCGSRWDRFTLNDPPTASSLSSRRSAQGSGFAPRLPDDSTEISFGRHKGMNIRTLRMTQRSYLAWMIHTAMEEDAQPDLRAAATYLMIKAALDGEDYLEAEESPQSELWRQEDAGTYPSEWMEDDL